MRRGAREQGQQAWRELDGAEQKPRYEWSLRVDNSTRAAKRKFKLLVLDI
jgi:hypothetical protein